MSMYFAFMGHFVDKQGLFGGQLVISVQVASHLWSFW